MDYKLDKQSGVPLYRQVQEYIVSLIHTESRASSKLPTEAEICNKFEISRATVRTAVMELVQEGVLERIPGKGTFIKTFPKTLYFANWLSTEKTTKEALSITIDEYNKKSERERVKELGIPFNQIERRLEIMTAGGRAPDIASLIYFWIPVFAYKGALEPVDDMYHNYFEGDMYPVTEYSSQYNGRFYGVPWMNAPVIFFFRRDVMEKYSCHNILSLEYYDELIELCEMIHTKSNGNVIPLSIPILNGGIYFLFSLSPFLLSFGGGLFDEEGKVILNTEKNMKAFTWLKKFIRSGHVNMTNEYLKNRRLFAQGKLAFIMEGPWMRSMITTLAGPMKGVEKNVGYRTLPKTPNGNSASVLRNYSLSIFKQSKDKEIAKDFLKYLTAEPLVNSRFYLSTGMLPARKSQIRNNAVFNDNFGKTVQNQMRSAYPIHVFSPQSFTQSINICAKAVRDLLLGGADVASTLNSHAEIIRSIQQMEID